MRRYVERAIMIAVVIFYAMFLVEASDFLSSAGFYVTHKLLSAVFVIVSIYGVYFVCMEFHHRTERLKRAEKLCEDLQRELDRRKKDGE